MTMDFTWWGLLLQASPLVKGVMLLLTVASLWSWMTIFHRFRALKEAEREVAAVETVFKNTRQWQDVVPCLQSRAENGMPAVLREGYKVYERFQDTPSQVPVFERVERRVQSALDVEEARLGHQLSLLATIGSISPYVGLFGTVWGIMTTIRVLGQAQQATLAMVAPGIAEALIATAMGLFVAIPAAVAYNRYASHISQLMNRQIAVSEQFMDLLYQRHRQY